MTGRKDVAKPDKAVVILTMVIALIFALMISAAFDGQPRYGDWRAPGDHPRVVQMGGRIGEEQP